MAYQIEVTRNGSPKKIIKNAINLRPLTFDTIEAAKAFADSHFALWRCDWKSQGRRAPTYRFVEVA